MEGYASKLVLSYVNDTKCTFSNMSSPQAINVALLTYTEFQLLSGIFKSKDYTVTNFEFPFFKKHQHFKISFYCCLKKTIPVLSCKTRVLVKLDWKDLIHLFHLKSISSKPCEIEVIFPFLHAVASMASRIGTGSSHSHSFPFTFPFLNSYLLSLRCRNKRVVGILLPDSQSCRLCIN